MSFRRIVANLDFERTIAAGEGRTPRPLPQQAARSAAGLGTLLRVFAAEDDRLWCTGRYRADRVPEVAGLPTPFLETGALDRLPPANGWLAWGETEPVAALRARDRAEPVRGQDGSELPLWSRVWQLPRPVPTVARHVHHRHTHTTLARELGYALPGQCWIDSIETLEDHLAAGGADHGPGERWILKPPLSAAGREWVRGEGRSLIPSIRSQVERVLTEGGSYLFEPRLELERDLGLLLIVTDYGVELVGRHDLESTPSGRFRSIRIAGPEDAEPESRFPQHAERAAIRIGERLLSLGFRGACGIDAWLGRTADGSFHPQYLGEINARLTFGWLAHSWRERLVTTGAISARNGLTLRTSREKAPPPDSIPLLLPGQHDSLSAWIES